MKILSAIYRMTMSDGTPCAIRADDAGKAIEAALRTYRGRTVLLCYSGATEEDCAKLRKDFPERPIPYPGVVKHDIPFHDPISPEAVLPEPTPVRAKPLPDPGTMPMFGEFEA